MLNRWIISPLWIRAWLESHVGQAKFCFAGGQVFFFFFFFFFLCVCVYVCVFGESHGFTAQNE